MIERWIEAFRGDTRASRGITAAHLAEVVDDDFDANPRGLCFGHPKNDDPAAGRITGAKLDGNKLLVKVADLAETAIDGIKSGKWLNRSAAFFDPDHEANPRPGKWTLRHVGLLGASAPGIPGMQPLRNAFSFDAEGGLVADAEPPADAVIFAAAPTPAHYVFESKEPEPMADRTPEQIAAEDKRLKDAQDALDKREQEFAARETRMFEAANSTTVDNLVAAGKVLPAEAPALKLVFNALDREELEFGAADKSDKAAASAKLATFLSTALPKRVPVEGEQFSPSGEFSASGEKPKSQAEIVAAANKLVKEGGYTFEAAVGKVMGETE